MGSERGECRGGQTDTVFMAERNVSENAKRGAIDGRTDGGGTQTDGGSGGGILPSILPRPRSLVTLAASTLHMRSGSKARREGRKEGAKKSELPPPCCLSIVAGGAAAKEEEEEEDKWTCPRRCV